MTEPLDLPEANAVERLRVVIVCDQPLIGRGLQIALAADSRLDVLPDLVRQRDAVPSVGALQPGLVLLDLTRSETDTATLIHAVLDSSGGAPVVVLADHDDDDAVLESLEAGARGFLSYESGLDHLVEVIVQVGAGFIGLSGHRLSRLVRRLVNGDRAAPSLVNFLTTRELQVLTRLTQGRSTRQIAAELSISLNTARTHIQNILNKLGVHSKLEAAAYAVAHGAG